MRKAEGLGMGMKKLFKSNTEESNSIAYKIKHAMSSTSLICLLVLGAVSLLVITFSTVSLLQQNMTETVQVASGLIEREIDTMKKVTYEIGCNPMLAGEDYSDDEKKEILFEKVAMYDFTNTGLTKEDNVDIVSGWDCTAQDTVVRALAGESYFSEPKIDASTGKLCSYFSAPLWKNGIANSQIIGTVIFMSNEHFLQDIVKNISISESCIVFILD